MVQPRHRNISSVKLVITVMVLFDAYIISFIFLAKPCKDINHLPLEKGEKVDARPTDHLPAFPNITVLCLSENRGLNTIGYVLYWPVQRALTATNLFLFARDPKADVYRGGAVDSNGIDIYDRHPIPWTPPDKVEVRGGLDFQPSDSESSEF